MGSVSVLMVCNWVLPGSRFSLPVVQRRITAGTGFLLIAHKRVSNLQQLQTGTIGKRPYRKQTSPASSKLSTTGIGTLGSELVPYCTSLDEEYPIKNVLVDLRNGRGPEGGRVVFPPTLSARQRRRAHEWAERLGLGHLSLGQGNHRCFTAWRQSVKERLSHLRKLLDMEEAASRASLMMEHPSQSWRVLQAKGILLYNASVVEREAASFGKERWVLEDGIGVERVGHVARFSQRARPGMPVCLAEKDSSGSWVVAQGQPPGRVAWSRGKSICLVFDHPPRSNSQQINSADVLLVPDSSSFDKMSSVITDCELNEKAMGKLLSALLGSGIRCCSMSTSMRTKDDAHHSTQTTALPYNLQNKGLQTEELLDKGLNKEQFAAVKLCTEAGVSPVVLIHGPFGTGKTRTLVEIVRQQVLAGKRVLVCAASNAAVDNMVLALLTADPMLSLARAGLRERVASTVSGYTLEALQDAQPEAAIAKKLRREAYALQLTAEKAATGREKRRNARKQMAILFKDARRSLLANPVLSEYSVHLVQLLLELMAVLYLKGKSFGSFVRLESISAAVVLQRIQVLCGTLTGFASSLRELGNAEESHFDSAVIDEASQAITPALLMVLPYLNHPVNGAEINNPSDVTDSPPVPYFVMAGDHQQLPPTVLSEQDNGESVGLGATLFEELMERDRGGLGTRIQDIVSNGEQWDHARLSILTKAHALASGAEDSMRQAYSEVSSRIGHISVSLRQQYRMPAQLMAFPSAAFYGAELFASQFAAVNIAFTLDANNEISILQKGMLLEVIDTAGAGFDEEKAVDGLQSSLRWGAAVEVLSTSNPGQANLTARVVHELLGSGSLSAPDIGVVTPYSAQVMLLRALMIDEVGAGLEIDSVDAYQGREKEVIVVDAVRSNTERTIGFLSDFHRLNVALTRARQKLVLIGDSATLSTDPLWAVFFEWVSYYRDKPSTGIRYFSSFEIPFSGSYW